MRASSLKGGFAPLVILILLLGGCASGGDPTQPSAAAPPPPPWQNKAADLSLEAVPVGTETDAAKFLEAWLGPHKDKKSQFRTDLQLVVPVPYGQMDLAGENIKAGIELWCDSQGLVRRTSVLSHGFQVTCLGALGELHTRFDLTPHADNRRREWGESMRWYVGGESAESLRAAELAAQRKQELIRRASAGNGPTGWLTFTDGQFGRLKVLRVGGLSGRGSIVFNNTITMDQLRSMTFSHSDSRIQAVLADGSAKTLSFSSARFIRTKDERWSTFGIHTGQRPQQPGESDVAYSRRLELQRERDVRESYRPSLYGSLSRMRGADKYDNPWNSGAFPIVVADPHTGEARQMLFDHFHRIQRIEFDESDELAKALPRNLNGYVWRGR